MVALAQLILNLPPVVGNDAAIDGGGGGGSNAAEPSSAGYEIGSSYNLPWSSDGAEKMARGVGFEYSFFS